MGARHDIKSKYDYKIAKVGFTNMRLPIRVQREGVDMLLIPQITIAMDFDKKTQGAHLSRLQTSVVETINSRASTQYIEELGKRILTNLNEKSPYKTGEVMFEFGYPLKRITPVSKYEIREVHDVVIKVTKNNGHFTKYIECKVIGNSVCRCEGHQQRSFLTVGFTTDLETPIVFRDLVDSADQAFSVPVHSIVRTEDEHMMATQMRNNPKFSEDLVRECLHHVLEVCREKKMHGLIEIRALSNDSIHLSDVFAEINKEV